MVPFSRATRGGISYVVDIIDGALVKEEVTAVIPSNTGVLLKGDAGRYVFEVAEEPKAIETNLLAGTTKAEGETFSKSGYKGTPCAGRHPWHLHRERQEDDGKMSWKGVHVESNHLKRDTTMKKYIQPVIEVQEVRVEPLLTTSPGVNDEETNSGQLSNRRRHQWDTNW